MFLTARFSINNNSNKQLTNIVLDYHEFIDVYKAKRHLLDAAEQRKPDINITLYTSQA